MIGGSETIVWKKLPLINKLKLKTPRLPDGQEKSKMATPEHFEFLLLNF
jgi:hypothetical protein